MKIWKYTLKDYGRSVCLDLPAKAKFLDIQIQNGEVTTWFLVDPTAVTERRQFESVGTGWDISPGHYLGTFQDGEYVWHLFEKLD